MPYIGNTIRAADDYRLIDDISSSFNGSTTSFALQVAGSAPVPFPKSPQQVLISVNGVIQEPDPSGSSGFNLVGTNIVFSSAPTNGHAFFGIIYATADYLNAGGNFPAGSLGAPSITFIGDENSGLYRKGGGSIGFVADATEIANTDSNGLTISSGNLILPDSIIHNGDADTKIRFPGTDIVSVETGGSERLRVDSSGLKITDKLIHTGDTDTFLEFGTDAISLDTGGVERLSLGTATVFNETGADVDFRVESDSNTHAFFVNAGNSKIGINNSSPNDELSVAGNVEISSGASNLKITSSNPSVRFTDTDASGGFGIIGVNNTSGSLVMRSDDGNALSSTYMGFEVDGGEKMRIDSSGRLLINKTTNRDQFYGGTLTGKLQVEGTDNNTRLTQLIHNQAAQNQHILVLGKSRGTSVGSYTVVQDDDYLGTLSFQGADGDAMIEGARIDAQVDGTPGNNDMPARLTFGTTSDGASSTTERMRIDASGKVHIGLTNGAGQFNVKNQNDSTTNAFEVYNDNGVRNAAFSQSSTGNGTMDLRTNAAAQTVLFRSDGTSHLTGGDLGIGVSSPSVRCDISDSDSTAWSTSNLSTALRVANSSGTNGVGAGIQLRTLNNNGAAGVQYIHCVNSSSNYDSDLVFSRRLHPSGTYAEACRITNAGNLKFPSGQGIDFSATSDGSNMSSELLDDYEEGSFTPKLGGTTNSGTYHVDGSGTYIKIGRKVTVSIRFSAVDLDNNASGDAIIFNLPFAPGLQPSGGVVGVTGDVQYYNVPFSTDHISNWYISSGSSRWAGLVSRSNTTWISFPASDFHASSLYMNFSGTYFTT